MKASRRAAISIRPSASSSLVTTRSAPDSSQIRAIAATAASDSARPSSARAKTIAAAPGSRSCGWNASTARIVCRSISSSSDGRCSRAIRAIASPAPRSAGKLAASVAAAAGGGRSRTVASVTIPSVPSEPHSSPTRS